MIVLNLSISCRCLFLSFSCWGLYGGGGALVLGVASVSPMSCSLCFLFYFLCQRGGERGCHIITVRSFGSHHCSRRPKPFLSQFMAFNVPWLFFCSFFPFLMMSSLTSSHPRGELAENQSLDDNMHEVVPDEFDVPLFW